jgi:hypothetical protein
MELKELIGDPLYQLNITLWMLQPQPNEALTVAPLLQRAGFSLRSIEPSLPLPPELITRLIRDQIPVSTEAAPDLLLTGANRLFVLWECKRSTFGPPTSQVQAHHRQATNFLVQMPRVLEAALALATGDVAETHLIYLSRLDAAHDQTQGLSHLRDALSSKEYNTVPFSVLALSSADTSIHLQQSGRASSGVPQLGELSSPQLIQTCADAETDPRPLYYMPWMPDAEPREDRYNFHSFGSRVLAAVAEVIGRSRPPSEAQFALEDIMGRATSGHFALWRNKRSRENVTSAARELIRNVLSGATPDLVIKSVGSPIVGYKVDLPHDKLKAKVIKALRQWPGDDWITPHVQMELPLDERNQR